MRSRTARGSFIIVSLSRTHPARVSRRHARRIVPGQTSSREGNARLRLVDQSHREVLRFGPKLDLKKETKGIEPFRRAYQA